MLRVRLCGICTRPLGLESRQPGQAVNTNVSSAPGNSQVRGAVRPGLASERSHLPHSLLRFESGTCS